MQEPSLLAFDMPPSLNLVISSFWFKVRDIQLFLPLEHLEAIVGLFTGLIAVLLCLKGHNREAQGETVRQENGWKVEQTKHTQHVYGPGLWCTNYSGNIKDQGSQIITTNTIMKMFEILRELPKLQRRNIKWINAVGKRGPSRLVGQRIATNFNLKKKKKHHLCGAKKW